MRKEQLTSYRPKNTCVSLQELEDFIATECQPWVGEYIAILAERCLMKAKKRGAPNFGPVQAREVALRIFHRSGGDILL